MGRKYYVRAQEPETDFTIHLESDDPLDILRELDAMKIYGYKQATLSVLF